MLLMRVVELDRLTEPYWDELVAGEDEPFGGIGEELVWCEKRWNLGMREDDGRLVAAAGAVLAYVQIGQAASFPVVGFGGLFVTRSARGRGAAHLLVERLLELADGLDAQYAMLFCLPELMTLYARFGFRPIEVPLRAEQPGGRIEVPLRAMWKALGGAESWPSGRVELLGEPF
jgi:GNAT superfamily N-acetyltransferase